MINEQIFFALNPWQRREWRLEPRLVQRTVTSKLSGQLDGAYIQVVTGARRAGKTVLIHQCVDHLLHRGGVSPKNIFYLNFDDLEFRSELKRNPHLLLEIIELFSGNPITEHSAPIYMFLDRFVFGARQAALRLISSSKPTRA